MSTTEASIPVECSCGRLFRVKPEAAGRIVRCPACRAHVEVSWQQTESATTTGKNVGEPWLMPAPSPTSTISNGASVPANTRNALPTIPLPESRKYPYLEILIIVYRVLASFPVAAGIVLFVMSIGTIVVSIFQGGGNFISSCIAAAISLGIGIFGAFIMAAGEIIRVIIDIQSNTLATARAAEQKGEK